MILKKVHRLSKYNQKAWIKQYNNMNTKLRQKVKNNFEKDFFELMNNANFGKTMENVRKERKRNCLVSEPSYHTKTFSTENLLAIEMTKIRIIVNKPVYLSLWVLDLSKTVMYKFWHKHVKREYGENAKPCYMNIDS